MLSPPRTRMKSRFSRLTPPLEIFSCLPLSRQERGKKRYFKSCTLRFSAACPSTPRTCIKRGISRPANIRETAAYYAYVRISRWSVTQKSPF